MTTALSPNLRLKINFLDCTPGKHAQEYWESVAFACEVLVSDLLHERPSHIGNFLGEWLSKPKHQCLMTPHVEELGLRVGDPVMACFYGEWYSATIRSINGPTIEVIWDAEWSSSKLQASAVLHRKRASSQESEQMNQAAPHATRPAEPVLEGERKESAAPSEKESDALPEGRGEDQAVNLLDAPLEWSRRLMRNLPEKQLVAKTRWPVPDLRQGDSSEALAKKKLKSEVKKFVAENRVDEKAARELCSAAPEVQKTVLDRGSCTNTFNPSSVVSARIREASSAWFVEARAREVSSAGGSSDSEATSLGKQVEEFIKRWSLDPRATAALRCTRAANQQAVLEGGGLETARNTSAIVLCRIKDAQKDNVR